MRLLVAIPHYFHTAREAGYTRPHGSNAGNAAARAEALSRAISWLHRLFGPAQHWIDPKTLTAPAANRALACATDVVVCTTRGRHALDRVSLPAGTFEHRPTNSEPLLLGYSCHEVLRERIGAYDAYAYVEDDLIARDPWLLTKLFWFTNRVGDEAVLQPNRYEVGPLGFGPVAKAYIDGDLPDAATAPFQDVSVLPELSAMVMDVPVLFRRARNPHAGCFFLNARQMACWAARPDFLDRSAAFVGPLESAATLGLMRTFRVYKAAPECASFCEIEHAGTAYLGNLRRRGT